MIDYLIVGQGLAGTLLSYFLRKAGQEVLVIDQIKEQAASQIAAGLINPITGRRYVKSWKVDTLIPFAKNTYQQLEKELDIDIFQERNILRTLFNSREENDWLLRTGDTDYQAYMLDKAQLGSYSDHTTPAFSYGEVRYAAQVNIPTLVARYREELKQAELLVETAFDYQALEKTEQSVQYKNIKARRIVFCEGYQAVNNPLFNYLPFIGAKGEILIVKIPEVNFEKILKHRVFIAPLGEDLYWIGSTYDWNIEQETPSEQGKAFLKNRLEDILEVPYEIVAHKAAIRPTVKDRRPFLGVHPEWPEVYIFNGLGTKGASLGPFFAQQMQAFLVDNQQLDAAVDIQRFQAKMDISVP
jgi:glycine/D-amino acid oxidase-like deaminating enzyme